MTFFLVLFKRILPSIFHALLQIEKLFQSLEFWCTISTASEEYLAIPKITEKAEKFIKTQSWINSIFPSALSTIMKFQSCLKNRMLPSGNPLRIPEENRPGYWSPQNCQKLLLRFEHWMMLQTWAGTERLISSMLCFWTTPKMFKTLICSSFQPFQSPIHVQRLQVKHNLVFLDWAKDQTYRKVFKNLRIGWGVLDVQV